MEKTVATYRTYEKNVEKISLWDVVNGELKGWDKYFDDAEEKLRKEMEEITFFIENFGTSLRDQQLLIFDQIFNKDAVAALSKKLKWDKTRKLGRTFGSAVLKGVLVVGTLYAVGLLAPGVATIGVVGVSLMAAKTGVSKFGELKGIASDLKDMTNLEKKAIKDVQNDLAELKEHFGIKTKNAAQGLAKHLSVASKYLTQRRVKVNNIDKEISELEGHVRYLNNTLGDVVSAASDINMHKVKKSAVSTRAKCDKASKKLQKLQKDRAKELREMEELKSTFVDAELLIAQLNDLNYQAPRTLASRIKVPSMDEAASILGELAEFEDVLPKK